MSKRKPRRPATCPAGWRGRYTVVSGDTMSVIAQRFRTDLTGLIYANPHIADPEKIYPGDVICVPGQIPFPLCLVLNKQVELPPGSGGVALAHTSFQGTQAVSFLATLLPPGRLGNYDQYQVEVTIPNIGTYGNRLYPSLGSATTWAATIDLPTAASLTPDTLAAIRPYNSGSGMAGPRILAAALGMETPPVETPLLKPGDYLPLTRGSRWDYEGVGNEFAEFVREVVGTKGNRSQVRETNPGTVSISVYETTTDRVTRIFNIGEAYEDINYLDRQPAENTVILQAPLRVGTRWQNNSETREIIATDAELTTRAGDFSRVVQVRISGQDPNSAVYEYYAPGVGLIEREFVSGDFRVASLLRSYDVR